MVTKNGHSFLSRKGCGCIGRGQPHRLSADVTSPGRHVLCSESHILAPYKPGDPQKAERARVSCPSLEMMSSEEGWRTLCIIEARQARLQAFSIFLMHQNHLGCLFKLQIPVNPIPRS